MARVQRLAVNLDDAPTDLFVLSKDFGADRICGANRHCEKQDDRPSDRQMGTAGDAFTRLQVRSGAHFPDPRSGDPQGS